MNRSLLPVVLCTLFICYVMYGSAQIQNTKLGLNALGTNLAGSYNTAIGYNSMKKNITGFSNTATGNHSLYFNSGSYNAAFGRNALYSNTNGNDNTANGMDALYSNTTGDYNSAFGKSTLYSSTTADYNTAIGYSSMNKNTIGHTNTATGSYSLYANISGLYNTAFGASALSTNTTGSWNTAIGNNAGVMAVNLTNATAIGNSAKAIASNQVRIGNEAVLSIGGFADWTDLPSDSRFKKNVKENVPGLDFINELRPVTYNVDMASITRRLRTNEDTTNNAPDDNNRKATEEKSREVHTGFIAQEVEAVAKKMNFDFNGVDAPKNEQDLYGLRYSKFVVPLVKALQELNKRTEEENRVLQEEVGQLKARLSKLEAVIFNENTAIKETTAPNGSSRAYLEQNRPNPSDESTTIRYYIPHGSTNAKVVINDMKGSIIKTIGINNIGRGEVLLNSGILSTGVYTYTLYVNGTKMDVKQMLIGR